MQDSSLSLENSCTEQKKHGTKLPRHSEVIFDEFSCVVLTGSCQIWYCASTSPSFLYRRLLAYITWPHNLIIRHLSFWDTCGWLSIQRWASRHSLSSWTTQAVVTTTRHSLISTCTSLISHASKFKVFCLSAYITWHHNHIIHFYTYPFLNCIQEPFPPAQLNTSQHHAVVIVTTYCSQVQAFQLIGIAWM